MYLPRVRKPNPTNHPGLDRRRIYKFRWHKKPGLPIAVFLLCYGLFRSFVEEFREPDAPFLGLITMGQMLSAIMLAASAFFFWYALKRKSPTDTQGKAKA